MKFGTRYFYLDMPAIGYGVNFRQNLDIFKKIEIQEHTIFRQNLDII